MPDYFQSSPWQDAANFGQGIGDSINQMVFQLPALRRQIALQQAELGLRQQEMAQRGQYQQAQLGQGQQEIDLRRQLQGAQIPGIQADTAYRNVQTAEANEKIKEAKQASEQDALIQQLFSSRGQLNNPITQGNPDVLTAALHQLQSAGAAPQTGIGVGSMGPVPVSPQDVTGLVDNAIRSLLASRAATSPAQAGSMVQPSNVPFGGTSVDTLQQMLSGGNQQGQVRQQFGPTQKNMAAVMMNQAMQQLRMEQAGLSRLTPSQRRVAEQQLDTNPQHQQAVAMIAKIQNDFMGGTNAPATNAVPPPHQRQEGQTIQTPKGTFKWTNASGGGWMPIESPVR